MPSADEKQDNNQNITLRTKAAGILISNAKFKNTINAITHVRQDLFA